MGVLKIAKLLDIEVENEISGYRFWAMWWQGR